MCADEPDFQKYPETIAEFAGIVAKHVSHCLLKGAARLLDGLRHVSVSHCVQRAVRGWEGRIWEVGDGEIDSPVAPSRVEVERKVLDDPLLVGGVAEGLTAQVQKMTGLDDVRVCFCDDPILEVRSD